MGNIPDPRNCLRTHQLTPEYKIIEVIDGTFVAQVYKRYVE